MPFSDVERKQMLQLKGVGATVIQRLEEIGYASLADLAPLEPEHITQSIAAHLGNTCWRNSPQARAAIAAIVNLARNRP